MLLYILRKIACIASAIFLKKVVSQRWANLCSYSHDIRKGVLRFYHLREHHKMTDILIRNSHTPHISKAFRARLEIICIFLIFRPLEDIHPSIIHFASLHPLTDIKARRSKTKAGRTHRLDRHYNANKCSYANPDLITEEGHEYALSFDYDNTPVTAVTTVPTAPEEVSFSATKIEVMSFQPPQAMSKAPNDGIEITWKNEEGEYYIVEGKTGSTNPVMDIEDEEDMPAKSFKLNYTQGTSATLSSSDFNYYGTYHISVIHINQEYAVMSQGGSTSSATLVDVKGNIDGGYGIFTGISSVTRTISVAKGSSPF